MQNYFVMTENRLVLSVGEGRARQRVDIQNLLKEYCKHTSTLQDKVMDDTHGSDA
jgi:hypothetical protein